MIISVGTIADIDFITDNLVTPFNINIEVANSLIAVNGCLLGRVDGEIVSASLMATAINDKGTGTVSKMIAIYGTLHEYRLSLAMHVHKLVKETHVNKKCAEILGINTADRLPWYKLDVVLSIFKDKMYIDSSTYSYKYNSIKKGISEVDEYKKLPVRRDTWFDDKAILDLRSIESNGLVDHGHGVYSFPFLSRSMCKSVLTKASTYTYEVNCIEECEYQIPEVVLADKDVAMYEKLLDIFTSNISSMTSVLYMTKIAEVRSIQLARYCVSEVNGGNWHSDVDSDITLVVALDEDYEGGGTAIKPYGTAKEIVIPKLPVGTALLFRGKYLQHKGLPISKGSRNILVVWTSS
jgi:hypothetical protein